MISIRVRVAPCLLASALGLACLAATAPTAYAQTGTVYTVTMLDVAPASAAESVTLLKQYREAARKQAGNMGVDVLQESGRPNRFVVYETWTDHAAYDANDKAAPRTELRDKLKPVANAALDRRNYRAISVAPGKTKPGAVYLQVHLDVFPPGLETTLAALKVLTEAARKGEGNLSFDAVQMIRNPQNHHTLYAAFENRKAFDEYDNSRYARHFRDIVGPLMGSPYDDRLFTLVD
jgi:quinol monooxygenase YgiN